MRAIAVCIVLFVLVPAGAWSAGANGSIGPYPIEIELSAKPNTEDRVVGRYRYEGKAQWLDLVGSAYSDRILELTETLDGVETGRFFLERVAGGWQGYWVDGKREFDVQIAGLTDRLQAPDPDPVLSDGVTGAYAVSYHFINGLWAPAYEVAFNGGTVHVAEVDADTLRVQFEFIVGPTYHFASFDGLAKRSGPRTFEHNAVLPGGDSACHLTFTFGQGTLSVSDNQNTWPCQFGVRAHANFELQKVSDTPEFWEDR